VLQVRVKLRRGYVSIVVIVFALVLLVMTALAPAVSTTTDFSIFNSGWNGTSDLAVSTYKLGKFSPTFEVKSTGTEMQVAQVGLDRLSLDPLSSALVEIGPTLPFTDSDGRIVGDFVRQGGILFLADDFGTGNSLLEKMGATSRISGQLVMDLAFDKKPQFPVCFDLRPSPLTRNVSSVLLNYPSSLVIDNATTDAVAYTSIASWLDTDNNGERGLAEPSGPFVIMAQEELGNGAIVLLSDPSALINGMGEYLNNSILKQNILTELSTSRSAVFFDESHRDFFDPVAITMKFTGAVSSTAKGAITVLAFVLTLWIATDYVDRALAFVIRQIRTLYSWVLRMLFSWRKPVPPKPKPTLEQIEEEVKGKHPDWRPGIIHYIIKERDRHSKAMLEPKEEA
jgi:hypothetical protein